MKVPPSIPERRARPGFVGRVLKTTLALSLFVAWVMLSLGRNREAASFLIGAAVGMGMLWAMRFAVGQALSDGRARWKKKAVAGALAVSKYGWMGLVLWWFVRQPWASAPAFAGGAAMTQVVLLLKALGTLLSPPDRKDPYTT